MECGDGEGTMSINTENWTPELPLILEYILQLFILAVSVFTMGEIQNLDKNGIY